MNARPSEFAPDDPFANALAAKLQQGGFHAVQSVVDTFERSRGHERQRVRIADGTLFYERWNRYMRRARWDLIAKCRLRNVRIDDHGLLCGSWRLPCLSDR